MPAYQILFVRNSPSSFRLYVKYKHKIYGFIASGEFKLRPDPNVFVRFNSRKFGYYRSHIASTQSVVQDFIKFIYDARNIKLLYIFFSVELL
jgi:hypothetical protein